MVPQRDAFGASCQGLGVDGGEGLRNRKKELQKEADKNLRVQIPQAGSWSAVSLYCWMMYKWQNVSERRNWQCLLKTIKYLIFNSVIHFMGLYSRKTIPLHVPQ